MKEKYSPELRWLFSGPVSWLYKKNIEPESRIIIKQIKEELKRKPNLSVMLYGNHQVVDDPYWEGYFSYRIDPKRSREVFALVSAFHTEEKEENKGTVLMAKLAEKCGIEMIPVVQSYQVDNPAYGFTKGEATKTYKEMILKIRELRGDDNKPLIAIIKPEGHRSENGALIRAETGIEHIMEKMKPVIAIPVASYSDEILERNKINFGKRINLRLGEITYYDGSDKGLKSTDRLMQNLALALPPEMRGYYGQ